MRIVSFLIYLYPLDFFFVPVKKCLAKDIQLRKGLWFKKEYSYSCWDVTVVTGHKTFAVRKQTTKQNKTHFVLHIQFWIPAYKMAQTTFRVRLCCSVKPSSWGPHRHMQFLLGHYKTELKVTNKNLGLLLRSKEHWLRFLGTGTMWHFTTHATSFTGETAPFLVSADTRHTQSRHAGM